MSLSLAKKSMKLFDSKEDNKEKHKKNKKSKGKSHLKNDNEAKIKKLLMLNTCMDDNLSKSLLKNVTKTKRSAFQSQQELKDLKAEEMAANEGVFTEEDFQRFEEELKKSTG